MGSNQATDHLTGDLDYLMGGFAAAQVAHMTGGTGSSKRTRSTLISRLTNKNKKARLGRRKEAGEKCHACDTEKTLTKSQRTLESGWETESGFLHTIVYYFCMDLSVSYSLSISKTYLI